MKKCRQCGQIKPKSNFCKGPRYKDGLQPWCADCRREYRQAYYQKNKDHINAKARKWAKDNPEKMREIDRRWKGANKEKMSERYRDWRKRNLAKDCARVAARRAAKIRATPPWADMRAIAAIYEEARRLTKEFGEPFEVDHIVPLNHPRVCGLHCEANLQAIPARRNRAKGNKAIYPGMWLKRDVRRIEAAYAQGRLFA